MEKLEFILCHSKRKVAEDILGRSFFGIIEELGLDCEPLIFAEEDLEYADKFPQDAVVYVHGNMHSGYAGVGYVRELVKKRKDLKFIVFVDSDYCSIGHFHFEKDYDFFRQAAEEDFDAANQVVISYLHPFDFVKTIDRHGKPVEEGLKDYLIQYLALQEAKK